MHGRQPHLHVQRVVQQKSCLSRPSIPAQHHLFRYLNELATQLSSPASCVRNNDGIRSSLHVHAVDMRMSTCCMSACSMSACAPHGTRNLTELQLSCMRCTCVANLFQVNAPWMRTTTGPDCPNESYAICTPSDVVINWVSVIMITVQPLRISLANKYVACTV